VHVWAFIQCYNYQPKVVLHKCDNPKCCNIKHLKAGTKKDNSKDAVSKGRQKNLFKKGQNHPNSKLTEIQVIEIKKLIKQGLSNTYISKLFNVRDYNISKIKNNVRWSHIE